MAAARLPWMGAAQVQQLLDARLRLLTSAQRVTTARQRTLQAAMAWSHALLSGTEQRVFRRLAVFRGSFGLDEAAEVASDAQLVGRWEAIDALGALVDKSLVQVAGSAEAAAPRYRLLESTRLFALAHLLAADEVSPCQARHVQAYCRLAQARMASLWRAPDTQWIAEIEPDIDNLHTAVQYAIDLRDVDALSVLADPVGWWSSLTNSGAGLRRWVDAIDALLQGTALPSRGRLQMLIGYAHRNIAPAQALPWLEQARACLEAGGDPTDLYRTCASLATCYARVGRLVEAQESLARAQALMQPDWPARLRLPVYDAAGFVAHFAGRSDDAEQAFRRFLALAQGARIELGVIAVSHNLADMALAAGRVDEAVRLGRDLVDQLRRMRHAYYLGFALGNLFAALVEAGDLASAAAAGSEALTLLRTEGNSLWLFDHFAALANRLGDGRAAALCVGYCDAGRASLGLSRDPTEARVADRVRQQLAASAVAADIARWLAEGAAMSGPAIDALVQALARQAADGAAACGA
jgi:tetratricopeptide (TPR) repeat protein